MTQIQKGKKEQKTVPPAGVLRGTSKVPPLSARPQPWHVETPSILPKVVIGFLWIFTIGLGAYVFWDLKMKPTQPQTIAKVKKPVHNNGANSARAENKVNRYLQDLNLRLETQKVLSREDLEKAKRDIGRELIQQTGRARAEDYLNARQSGKTPNDQQVQDPHEQLSERDLYETNQYVDSSPSYQIQNDVANVDEANQIRAGRDQAYIDQFLENARKQGYEIELDDQYQVLKIRKITGGNSTSVRGLSGSR